MSGMRRFWDSAEAVAEAGGWVIRLDGKPMRIPGAGALHVPGLALADAIAAEWQSAGGTKGGALTMESVPLTRLAGTAQERVAGNAGPVAAELARYAETDVLCYRAAGPETLMVRQARQWQPWLDWLDTAYGARLEPVEGVMFRPQDPVALARVQSAMAARTVFELTALGLAIPALGSAVLGLALADGALGAEAAHDLACLDELFEAEAWGEDAEATRRRAAVRADLVLAERFMRLSAAG